MPDYPARRAEPGQRFGYTTAEGKQRELHADDDGVVSPKTAEDAAILDTFDLPVARIETKTKAGKADDGGRD